MIACTLSLVIVALALGAFSSLLFIWQWAIGAPTLFSSWLILGTVAIGSVCLFLYLNRRFPPSSVRPGAAWVFLGLALLFAVYWMIQYAKSSPLGAWDAWAIWNLHARFLYRGGMAWKELLDPALFWSHNDYPFLLPALVSGSWILAGSEQQFIPALLSIVFTLLPIGIVSCATSACSGDQRGWVAGLILLATPSFLLSSSAQMSDIPLSCYILITFVCLQFAEVWPEVRGPMMGLAGLSTGFAAWTKNEGLLFMVAVFASHFISAMLLGSWRSYRKEVIAFGLGLAPVLILILSFKGMLAPPNDLQPTTSSFERLAVPGRYLQVAVAFAKGFATLGSANTTGALAAGLLIVLYLFLYISPIRRLSVASLTLPLILLLMLAGYFMVYVTTPNDLQAHLESSLDRLLLQLWPSFVFIIGTVPISLSVAGSARKEEWRF